jgi:LacI family transcriptional regulator
MATIKDVAALAGVSFTTVSHVMNQTRPVSAPVEAKVRAAILQLNYVPSGVARSLRGSQTGTIGLLVPNNTNSYFAELARGIEDYCERNGYCVFLCNSDDDVRKQQNYLRVLREKRIDGLIVASAGDDAVLADLLAAARVPVVMVDRQIAGLEADAVQIDHEAGAYLATRHLLELGHRNIACIGGPQGMDVSALRLDGFRRAMAEREISILPEAIVQSDFSSPGGYDAAKRLFHTVKPSAIFAGNDMMGIGALRAAAELGLRVPGEVSVIGFDDIELGRYVFPALTTVGQPILLLGETTAHTLLARIGGSLSGPPHRQVMPPRLTLRESTGPVPACSRSIPE